MFRTMWCATIATSRDLATVRAVRLCPLSRGGTESSCPGLDDVGDDMEDKRAEETQVFQKYDRLLHGSYSKRDRKGHDLISMAFLKKYLQYAKDKYKPALTEQASPLSGLAAELPRRVFLLLQSAQLVANAYADLRTKEEKVAAAVRCAFALGHTCGARAERANSARHGSLVGNADSSVGGSC